MLLRTQHLYVNIKIWPFYFGAPRFLSSNHFTEIFLLWYSISGKPSSIIILVHYSSLLALAFPYGIVTHHMLNLLGWYAVSFGFVSLNFDVLLFYSVFWEISLTFPPSLLNFDFDKQKFKWFQKIFFFLSWWFHFYRIFCVYIYTCICVSTQAHTCM